MTVNSEDRVLTADACPLPQLCRSQELKWLLLGRPCWVHIFSSSTGETGRQSCVSRS